MATELVAMRLSPPTYLNDSTSVILINQVNERKQYLIVFVSNYIIFHPAQQQQMKDCFKKFSLIVENKKHTNSKILESFYQMLEIL